MQRTLILFKPDAVQRRLMGEVVERGAGVMGITPEIKQYL